MSMVDGTPIDRGLGAGPLAHAGGGAGPHGLPQHLGGPAAGPKPGLGAADDYQEVEKSNIVMLVRRGAGAWWGGGG
jgi:hypothetical protein